MSNWNGKIKCKINIDEMITKNKTYEVINGKFQYDDEIYSKEYENFNDFFNQVKSLRGFFEEVKESKIPVLCELLGVEPNEEFKIKNGNGVIWKEIFYINCCGMLCRKDSLSDDSIIALLLINEFLSIVKLPFYQFSESEITTLKALWLNNYCYIAREGCNNLWAYESKPDIKNYGYRSNGGKLCELNKDFFKQIQWGNEPLNIEHELSKID